MNSHLASIFLHGLFLSIPAIALVIWLFIMLKFYLPSKGINRTVSTGFRLMLIMQSFFILRYIYGLSSANFESYYPYYGTLNFILVLILYVFPLRFLTLSILLIGFIRQAYSRQWTLYTSIILLLSIFFWSYALVIPGPVFPSGMVITDPAILGFKDRIILHTLNPDTKNWLRNIDCNHSHQYIQTKDYFSSLPKTLQVLKPSRIDIFCQDETKYLSFLYATSQYPWHYGMSLTVKENKQISLDEIDFVGWAKRHIDFDKIHVWMNSRACESFEISSFRRNKKLNLDLNDLPVNIRQNPEPSTLRFICDKSNEKERFLFLGYGGGFQHWGIELFPPSYKVGGFDNETRFSVTDDCNCSIYIE